MDSIDLERIEKRARFRYEMRRLWRAVWGFAPVAAIVGPAALVAGRPSWTLAIGLAVFALGVVLLWYGRDVKRAVLPGLAAGLVPLVFALCAPHLGHACVGDSCMNFCVPACTLGGGLAGLGVGVFARRHRQSVATVVAASFVALLTGAMGCACIGLAGVAGLAAGFALGLVPALASRMAR